MRVEFYLKSYLNIIKAYQEARTLSDYLGVAARIITYVTLILPLLAFTALMIVLMSIEISRCWNKKVNADLKDELNNSSEKSLRIVNNEFQQNDELPLLEKSTEVVNDEFHDSDIDYDTIFPNPFPTPQGFFNAFDTHNPLNFWNIKKYCIHLEKSQNLPNEPLIYSTLLDKFQAHALAKWPLKSKTGHKFVYFILIPIYQFQIIKGCGGKETDKDSNFILNSGISTLANIERALYKMDFQTNIALYISVVEILQSIPLLSKFALLTAESRDCAESFLNFVEQRVIQEQERASTDVTYSKQLKTLQAAINNCFEPL